MSHTPLQRELKKYFGFSEFKGLQEPVIENLLEGKDSFVIMPTGGGKSLCYQLPALISPGTAIVVSPLIALMKNQVDAIRGISSEEGIAHVLNSSLTKTATPSSQRRYCEWSDQTVVCCARIFSERRYNCIFENC